MLILAALAIGWLWCSGRLPFGGNRLPRKISTYTINITGTPGLQFDGVILEVQPNMMGRSRRIQGTVPATYEARGAAVQCDCFKKSDDEFLRIELLLNGQVVDSSEGINNSRLVHVISEPSPLGAPGSETP